MLTKQNPISQSQYSASNFSHIAIVSNLDYGVALSVQSTK